MSDKNKQLANVLMGKNPNDGGLNATNYPNPDGLRAYKNPDGSYGGQMMPKYTGWLGSLPNIAYPNMHSTELSIGDDKGEFPSMTPNLSPEQLTRVLSLKHNQRMPQDIVNTAQEFANQRRAQGLSPFKDIWDDNK